MGYIVVFICLLILFAFIFATNSALIQSKKDWGNLRELQKRASKVKTKEDIEFLYTDLTKIGSNVYNKYVNAELKELAAYLRGLYQQFKD